MRPNSDLNTSPGIRADLLKFAMQEDRTEIRFLKERIYNLVSFIAVSSFAVTAFLAGKDSNNLGKSVRSLPIFAGIDLAFVALLWIIFLRLMKDLNMAHLCLEMREQMIADIENPAAEFLIFKPCGRAKPWVRETGLYWVAALASTLIIGKAILAAYFVRSA